MKYTTMGDYSNYPKLQKSRVKAHQRRTKSGKVVQIREHQTSRKNKAVQEEKLHNIKYELENIGRDIWAIKNNTYQGDFTLAQLIGFEKDALKRRAQLLRELRPELFRQNINNLYKP